MIKEFTGIAALFMFISLLYYAAVVFVIGFVILWLLQYFHVLGMGCSC